MLRSVAAVVAGYALFAVSAVLIFGVSGRDPHAAAPVAFMIGSTLYGVVFALLAGYLCARVARRAELAHGLALGALLGAASVVSIVARRPGATVWSQTAALTLMAPAAVLGAWLRALQLRRRAPGGDA